MFHYKSKKTKIYGKINKELKMGEEIRRNIFPIEKEIQMEKSKDILQVKMFGNFSMMYNGDSLLGRKVSGTQFVYLMQLLLHNKERGVSRADLEEAVFGDRDIEDRQHAMQSIIYNAKKKLRAMGLPEEVNYIKLKKGVFYWNNEIPVETDTELFEEYYRKSDMTDDEEKKIEYLRKAIHQYRGEFLQNYTTTIWIAVESRRYNDMFCSCVEELCTILQSRGEFPQLEALGTYAATVMPFADWESITMDALIGQCKYEEASNLYSKTVDMYFEERGLRPSIKMVASLNRLGDQILHPVDVLDDIQNKLTDDSDDDGGYGCSYPVFRGVYQVVSRMMERNGMSLYLMLCSIVDSKGNMMKDSDQLDELSKRLGDAIQKSVRKSDVYNRYSKGQYLVLLFNTTRENCSIIQKRINYNFLTGRQRTGVQYYVNSVYTEQLPE